MCAFPCGQGFAGDGGPALKARLAAPYIPPPSPTGRMAFDAAGNLYFADTGKTIAPAVSIPAASSPPWLAMATRNTRNSPLPSISKSRFLGSSKNMPRIPHGAFPLRAAVNILSLTGCRFALPRTGTFSPVWHGCFTMADPGTFPDERATRALGHARPSARLQHLDAEHERLRKKVLSRRRELERFEADLREIGALISARGGSLIEEVLRLDAAIHASFADILARKTLSRRARAQICEIYATLERAGMISSRDGDDDDDDDDAIGTDEWYGPDEHARRHAGGGGETETETEPGAGAHIHRGRATHLRDLRKTFLTLADAIHPDKVQGEEEKRVRTEAMKELNHAYREGDVARILELERAWNLEGRLDAGDTADALERRCQALERKNELLAEQLRALSQTLRLLRRTTPGSIVIDVRRLRRERDVDPIATVLEPLELEREILRRLADFVQSYQNGKMSLAQFIDGPQLAYYDSFDDDDELDLDDDFDLDDIEIDDIDLDEVLEAMREVLTKPRRRTSRGTPKKRRRRK